MNEPLREPPRWIRALAHLPSFFKLFRRLWNDPRVPIYRKAVPVLTGFLGLIAAMWYFALKIDLDFIPIIGKLDDVALVPVLVFLPGAWLLIRLSPPEIVAEHIRAIDEERRSGKP